MITALDQLNLDPALAARQQAAASGGPNLFASHLDQAVTASAGAHAQDSLAASTPGNTTALLAAQVAQMWASQTPAQPARTEQEEKSLRDSAVLQSMNFQASAAFSQGNVGAFNVLQVMINKQMTDMGLLPPPAAQATQATAKASTPKAAAKAAAAAKKATTYSATTASVASNAGTASTASTAAASNASTANSASAALEDALLSNASTVGASSSQLASNAGTAGDAAQLAGSDNPAGTVAEALDHLTWELKTLLSKLDEDDRDAALAGIEAMARELAGSAAPDAGAASTAAA